MTVVVRTLVGLVLASSLASGQEWLVGAQDSRVRACEADMITTGAGVNDHIGHTMAAGDWNGDGYDDLISGNLVRDVLTEFVPGSGVVWIYLNDQAGGFTRAVEITGIPNTPDMAPPVTFLGDIDGDGGDDFAVGGPGFGPNHIGHGYDESTQPPLLLEHSSGQFHTGSVYLFLSDTDAEASDPLTSLSTVDANYQLDCPTGVFGINDQPHFGFSLAAAGDVNNDGIGDLVVGAPALVFQTPFTQPEAGTPQPVLSGRAFVYHGRDLMTPSHPFELAQVLDAGKGSSATPPEPGDYNRFGWSVAGAGDLDGDGIDDIAVGAIEATFGGAFNYSAHGDGFVDVYFGATLAPLSMPHRINPARQSDDPTLFGFTLAGGVNLNAAGGDELLVGCPRYSVGSNTQGGVYAYSFDPARVKSDAFSSLQPVVPPDDIVTVSPGLTDSFLDQVGEFGWSLSSLGQYDPIPGSPNASRREFLVGAFKSKNIEPLAGTSPCPGDNAQGGPQTGRAYVLMVPIGGSDPTVQAFYRGEKDEPQPTPPPRAGRTRLGTSVAVGDFDNDGHVDTALAASGYAANGISEAGRIYVFLNPNAPSSP